MSGINSLSGLNKVNVDFRPAVNPNEQNSADANGPGGAQDVAQKNVQQGKATSVVRQLDVLLLGAAKKSVATNIVRNVETVGQTLVQKGVLNNEELSTLKELAENAANKLKALDKLTGRDLAKFMTLGKESAFQVDGVNDAENLDLEDFEKEDAKVITTASKVTSSDWASSEEDWEISDGTKLGRKAEDNPVKSAIDAQLELSQALEKFNGKLAKSSKVDAALQDQFTELQFQCDRRASEIDSIVFRMADLAFGNGKVDDPQVKALLDATFMELMPREAIMMHGTAEAFEIINKTMVDKLRPLAQKLDNFAADGSKVLTKDEIGELETQMSLMKNAIAEVRANGINIRGKGKTHTHTEVDKSLLDGMDNILDDVSQKIKNAKSVSLKRSVDAFINELGDSLSPEKLPSVGGIRTDDESMAGYNEVKNSFLGTLKDYADGKLTPNQFETNIDGCILRFKVNLRSVKTKLFTCGLTQDDWDGFTKIVDRLHLVTAQFKELMRSVEQQKGDKSEFSIASSDVRRLMLDEVGLSNVVESRVRGFKAGDVDSATEESNITGSRFLGGGAGGKTYLLTTKTGSEIVFKAELDSRLGLDAMQFSSGDAYKDTQKAANLNLATQDTAKALGCGDLVVKYSVGSHNGQFGFFMEKAKGFTGADFANRKQVKCDGIAPHELSFIEDDAERAKIQGELAKKLNKLMWLDLITGQGDRHWENYFIHIDKDTHEVTVKAIDNDASFTARHIGIQKYVLDQTTAAKFLGVLKKECETLYDEEDGLTEYDMRVSQDAAIEHNADGTVTVDLEMAKSPEVKMALNATLGIHGIVIPEEIDKDLYDKLVALKSGTDARKDYIESLRPRLSEEALEATEKRLDSVIKHAEKLYKEGKVYGDEQWKDPNVLSELTDLKTSEEIEQSDGSKVKVNGGNGRQFVNEYFLSSCPSYFKRDCFDMMF